MKLKKIIKGYIGDRAFYGRTLAIVIPMVIQNVITNLVNLLDNLMVGSLGTEQMSGVAIVNQFIFVFNLVVFGAVSGAGIFTAQFNGRGDTEGVRHTLRVKLVTCIVIGTLGVGILLGFGGTLINSFLHESEDIDLALTLLSGENYLTYIIIGLIPFALSQAYASTLRETGETVVPMIASVASIATNFIFNSLLIFGLFGLPALGVVGAAIATSLSRFVELLILVIYTHTNKRKCSFAVGLFKNFRVPAALIRQIAIKGAPVLLNELFWSLSVTMCNQCYSTRGLDVVAAMNISFTLQNLLSVAYFALSSSIAIIVGNLLGAGKLEEAKEEDKRLLAFAFMVGSGMMCIQLLLSPVFPLFYNVTDNVRELSGFVLRCFALTMPAAALATSTYYTIRSGGRVFITMLFDSVYAWAVVMPVAYAIAYLTDLPFEYFLPIILVVENLKLLPGLVLVHKGIWVRRIDVE